MSGIPMTNMGTLDLRAHEELPAFGINRITKVIVTL